MSFQKFKKQVLSLDNFEDPASVMRIINTLQNAIADSINGILSKLQNDSTILTNQSLLNSKLNIVNHKLNRKLSGWKIVGQNNQADFWDDQANNPSPNLTLWLYCSADVTANIEVF